MAVLDKKLAKRIEKSDLLVDLTDRMVDNAFKIEHCDEVINDCDDMRAQCYTENRWIREAFLELDWSKMRELVALFESCAGPNICPDCLAEMTEEAEAEFDTDDEPAGGGLSGVGS
jgi:hypothetical protein